MISYGICLSLSDLLHLVWLSLVVSMLLQIAGFLFNGWVVVHCVYVPHLYPFICWCTFRLFPYLGCCEWCCYEHKGACIFLNCSFVWMYAQEWDCWIIWIQQSYGSYVILFSLFWRVSALLVATPTYVPKNSLGVFHLLRILSNICYLYTL